MLQNGLLQQYLTGTTTSIVDTTRRFEARSPTRFHMIMRPYSRSSAQFGRSESTQSLVPGSVRSIGVLEASEIARRYLADVASPMDLMA